MSVSRVRVRSITLQHYRNFQNAHIDFEAYQEDFLTQPLVLTAPNGAGKTNVLEALSLLSPGKGLRGDRLSYMQSSTFPCEKGAPQLYPWQVGVSLTLGENTADLDPLHFGTGLVWDGARERRMIKRCGVPLSSQAGLSEELNVVWFTPDMGRMLRDSSTQQRQFIDRLVFSMDPTHALRRTQYDKLLKERNTLLKDMRDQGGLGSASWLEAVEDKLAPLAVAIVQARHTLLTTLHDFQRQTIIFPSFSASMVGECEDVMGENLMDTESSIALLKAQWRSDRVRDMARGSTSLGPHRSSLQVQYVKKQMPGEFCSTGEQKMLVLAIILAFVRMPSHAGLVVLLDDVMDHLDQDHRAALMESVHEFIRTNQGHVWLTGTNPDLFRTHGLDCVECQLPIQS